MAISLQKAALNSAGKGRQVPTRSAQRAAALHTWSLCAVSSTRRRSHKPQRSLTNGRVFRPPAHARVAAAALACNRRFRGADRPPPQRARSHRPRGRKGSVGERPQRPQLDDPQTSRRPRRPRRHALVPPLRGAQKLLPHTPRRDPAPAGQQQLSKDVLRRRGEQSVAPACGGVPCSSWAADAAAPFRLAAQVWDPVMIIGQIVSVQCIFYITLGLLETVLVGEARRPAPSGTALHAAARTPDAAACLPPPQALTCGT